MNFKTPLFLHPTNFAKTDGLSILVNNTNDTTLSFDTNAALLQFPIIPLV